ncbi:MAG: hypothetical protein H7343_21990 [Undibacterium sp.]|nr:hypothetical protein [Opitutaceae bacterium]
MSLSELKQEAQTLTSDERIELRSYLRLLDLKEDPARQQHLFAALDRAQAGQSVGGEDVRRALSRLPSTQP